MPLPAHQGSGREGAPCPAASVQECKVLPALPGAHGLSEEQAASAQVCPQWQGEVAGGAEGAEGAALSGRLQCCASWIA